MLAGVSGFRVYIKNHDYIALSLRYLVCVDKIYDTFCGNVGQRVTSLSRSLSLSLSLSLALSLSRAHVLSLSFCRVVVSFSLTNLYIRIIHSLIGLIEDDSIITNNSILTKLICGRTK